MKHMNGQEPVKIPDIPGKINIMKKEGANYVRFLAGRGYNAQKGYTESDWILIGRQAEESPGLMYPNDNYERLFSGKQEEGAGAEKLTPEELDFIRRNRIYGMYKPFFDALYHEFRQQARKRPETLLNAFRADSLNQVLQPLKAMMGSEEYAGLLGLAEAGEDGKGGMSNSDVMILLTQYKSALAKFRRKE